MYIYIIYIYNIHIYIHRYLFAIRVPRHGPPAVVSADVLGGANWEDAAALDARITRVEKREDDGEFRRDMS